MSWSRKKSHRLDKKNIIEILRSIVSNNLLVSLTLCFIVGVGASPFLEKYYPTYTHPHIVPSLLAILLITTLALFIFRRLSSQLPLVLLSFLTAGLIHGIHHHQPPTKPNHIYQLITKKSEAILIGKVATYAKFDGSKTTIIIDSEKLRKPVDKNLIPTKGQVILYLNNQLSTPIPPGKRVVIRATLQRPSSSKTPGTFDYSKYLAQKNIWVSGYIPTSLYIKKLEATATNEFSFIYTIEAVREKIGQFIDSSVEKDSAAIYKAILIGDRSKLPHSIVEKFIQSGTMHILAVSGLHVSILGALLFGLFYIVIVSIPLLSTGYNCRKIASFCTAPCIIFYGLLAGMNPPVFRSVIMSLVVILSLFLNKKKSLLPLLACAALCILFFHPLQLFTASFLLSFSAILGIYIVLPLVANPIVNNPSTSIQSHLFHLIQWIYKGFIISLAASLATAPIALLFFNRISLVGPIANLFIEPLICLWSLPFGILGLLFYPILPSISCFLLQIGSTGIDLTLLLAGLFSSFSFAFLWASPPSISIIMLYYIIMVLPIFIFPYKRNVVVSFCCCVLLISLIPFRPEKGSIIKANHFSLSFLNVGQGSSTLVEFPSGYRVLIDGGGSSHRKRSVGERVIIPYLRRRNIRTIDAIIISHPDGDHFNGLLPVFQQFSPNLLWIRGKDKVPKEYNELIEYAKTNNISVQIPRSGEQISDHSGTITCISNTYNLNARQVLPGKNDGLVLKFCSQKGCVLFPGDINKQTEQLLIDENIDLSADILVAAHHGSRTSNSKEFIQAVSPKTIIVSASKSLKKYFPHQSLKEISRVLDIPILTTYDKGTIELTGIVGGLLLHGYQKSTNNPLLSFEKAILLNKKRID